ncbi:MAG: activator of HSP90 ATPase [Parasphingorhabdus sp.]
MSQPIHHEVLFSTGAESIFEALINAKIFGEVTGSPATIDAISGGKFSCFDGMITGQTIEIIPNSRLVQAWRVGNWQPGIYSIVKFELEKLSEKKTKLIFDHTGFPEEHRGHLDQGWHERYWTPLTAYLNA